MSCPSHMSRFLTESAGPVHRDRVGVRLQAGIRFEPSWTPTVSARPPPLYVATGSRPDFIVQTTSGWHGIEARGRGSSGPVGPGRPVAVQKKKLEGMHDWSAKVAKHPTHRRSSLMVDVVGMDHRRRHFGGSLRSWRACSDSARMTSKRSGVEMSAIASTLADVDDPRVRRVDALDRRVSVVSRPIQENYGNGRPAWLTVASWSERMTDRELRERRGSTDAPGTEASQELLGDLDPATIGAFMATAITDRPPLENELATLLQTIVAQTTDLGDDPGPAGELR